MLHDLTFEAFNRFCLCLLGSNSFTLLSIWCCSGQAMETLLLFKPWSPANGGSLSTEEYENRRDMTTKIETERQASQICLNFFYLFLLTRFSIMIVVLPPVPFKPRNVWVLIYRLTRKRTNLLEELSECPVET